MAHKEDAEVVKITRTRSPNYPVVGFPQALQRTQEFYNKYKKSTVPIGVIHEAWGLARLSAYLKQIVAALKSFGLLNVKGEADKRELSITDEAYRILENAPDRQQIINKLVLMPKIYNDLWEKYKSTGIPSESVLKEYLQWGEYNFNKKVIDAFIADFRDSMALVKNTPNDIIEEKQDQGDEYMGGENSMNPPSKSDTTPLENKDYFVINAAIGSLKVRYPMNKEKLEVIQKFIDAEQAEHKLEDENQE